MTKTITILSPRDPIPVYTGLLERVYQLSRALGREHDVSVIYPHEPNRKSSESGREPEERPFERLGLRSPAIGALERLIPSYSALRGLYNLHPWLYPQVRNHMCRTRPDTVIVEFPFLMPLALSASRDIDCEIILSEHNVEYQFVKRLGSPLWSGLQKFEIAMCNRADAVVTVSQTDRQTLAMDVDDEVDLRVAPNGVDINRYSPDVVPDRDWLCREHDLSRPIFIYHGNLGNAQNSEAIEILLDRVFPAIREQILSASLLLVGADPPDCDGSGIACPGVVQDLPRYIASADVATVPLMTGSGTRLKILEYLSSEVPVVTTPVGAEGLPLENEINALIVEDPADMANEAVRLTRDDSLAGTIRSNGRELVESRFSWSETLSPYLELLTDN